MKGDLSIAAFQLSNSAILPTAGPHVLIGLANDKTYDLISVTFTLLTSAVVANRIPQIVHSSQTQNLAIVNIDTSQQASETRIWSAVLDGPLGGVFAGNVQCVNLPRIVIAPMNGRVGLNIVNADAGDVISQMFATVVER